MFGAIAGGIASALAGGAMSKLFGGGQKAASGGIQGDVLATDNNTVGMGDAGIKSAIQGSNVLVSVGADIAFDADPKFFACLVRFESSSVPTTLPTAYDVYPLDGRH